MKAIKNSRDILNYNLAKTQALAKQVINFNPSAVVSNNDFKEDDELEFMDPEDCSVISSVCSKHGKPPRRYINS